MDKTPKGWLTEQIRLAHESYKSWPSWMKKAAKFETYRRKTNDQTS